MSFSHAKVAKIRPKILAVLYKRLSTEFDRLSTSQLVLLTDLVARNKDRDLMAKLELNKFLESRLASLNVSEMVSCYVAISNQNDTSLHKALEENILNNIHVFRVDALSDLLYNTAKSRVASKYLMKAVLNGLEENSDRFPDYSASVVA